MVSFWCYLRLEFHYKEVLQNLSRTTCTFVSSKLQGKTSSGTDPRRTEYRRIQIPKVPTPDVLSFVFHLWLFHHFFTKELSMSFVTSSIFTQGAPGRHRTEWAPDIGVPWRTWVERTRGGPGSREAERKETSQWNLLLFSRFRNDVTIIVETLKMHGFSCEICIFSFKMLIPLWIPNMPRLWSSSSWEYQFAWKCKRRCFTELRLFREFCRLTPAMAVQDPLWAPKSCSMTFVLREKSEVTSERRFGKWHFDANKTYARQNQFRWVQVFLCEIFLIYKPAVPENQGEDSTQVVSMMSSCHDSSTKKEWQDTQLDGNSDSDLCFCTRLDLHQNEEKILTLTDLYLLMFCDVVLILKTLGKV